MAQSLKQMRAELAKLKRELAKATKRANTARQRAERAQARLEQANDWLQESLSVLESTYYAEPKPFAAEAMRVAVVRDQATVSEAIVAARQQGIEPSQWATEDWLDDVDRDGDWSIHDVYEVFYDSSGELG